MEEISLTHEDHFGWSRFQNIISAGSQDLDDKNVNQDAFEEILSDFPDCLVSINEQHTKIDLKYIAESESAEVRNVALNELIQILQDDKDFPKYFSPDDVQVIVNALMISMSTNRSIIFLGFLTFQYDFYSSIIANQFFFEFVDMAVQSNVFAEYKSIENQDDFPKYSIIAVNFFNLLANVFDDVGDSFPHMTQNLFMFLLSIPPKLISDEYLRLIYTIANIPNTPTNIAFGFITILSKFLRLDIQPQYLESSLNYMEKLMENKTRCVSTYYVICPYLKNLLDILEQARKEEILVFTLKLIRKAIDHSYEFVESMAKIDFCQYIKLMFQYHYPKVIKNAVKVVNSYIKSSPTFGAEEAEIFVDFDISFFFDSNFRCKIELLNFFCLLINYLPVDVFMNTFNDAILTDIFDLFESDDNRAKKLCFAFFVYFVQATKKDQELYQRIINLLNELGVEEIISNEKMNKDEEVRIAADRFQLVLNTNF